MVIHFDETCQLTGPEIMLTNMIIQVLIKPWSCGTSVLPVLVKYLEHHPHSCICKVCETWPNNPSLPLSPWHSQLWVGASQGWKKCVADHVPVSICI